MGGVLIRVEGEEKERRAAKGREELGQGRLRLVVEIVSETLETFDVVVGVGVVMTAVAGAKEREERGEG